MSQSAGDRISVCLLTYNHANVVESTVRSILDQTIDGYEVIISDDSSADGTWERILTMAGQDARITPVRTAENMGMARNANFAVSHSARPYIALLHHDDIYRRDLLEKWASVMDRFPDTNFVFNPYDIESADYTYGARLATERIDGRDFLERHLFARWGCPVRGTAMIRRSAWEKVGGIRARFDLLADIDMWMRLARTGAVGYVPEPVIKPRHSRPDYYPDIYTGKQWHWKRRIYLYEVHATNHLEYYNRQNIKGIFKWWQFRTRLSLETAKWLTYAVVKRKRKMIETCAESETSYDQLWLRAYRRLVRIAACPFIAGS